VHNAPDLALAPALSSNSVIVACGIQIKPLARRERLHLGLALPNAKAVGELEQRLEIPLPRGPAWTQVGPVSVFALGSRAWLLEGDTLGPVRAKLGSDPRALGANAAEVSDAFEAFRLTGEQAGVLLSTGCSIDLHPSAFPVGTCAWALLARLDVVLTAVATGYDLRIERSYARHLWAWFENAALEFGR
jgi:sarcosine oxidase subunit gamma